MRASKILALIALVVTTTFAQAGWKEFTFPDGNFRVVFPESPQKQMDAERYDREQYPKINEMLSQHLATAPVVRTYNVHTSTTHKIAAGKAA